MQEPAVRFDLRGGSPTLLEVVYDGKRYELRLALNVMDIQVTEGAVNPAAPDQPLFAVNIGVNVQQKLLTP